jgi:hypothetical protein
MHHVLFAMAEKCNPPDDGPLRVEQGDPALCLLPLQLQSMAPHMMFPAPSTNANPVTRYLSLIATYA